MTTGQWILVICGGISTIGGAAAVIVKVFKPIFSHSKRLEEVERHDKTDLLRFSDIDKKFHLQELESQAVIKALYAIMEHEISGNSIEKLKTAKSELVKYIIEK